MNLKQLLRMKRDETQGQPAKREKQNAESSHESENSASNNMLGLQNVIGNRGMQRLMSQGQLNPQTGLIQAHPNTENPSPTPTHEDTLHAENPTQADPNEIVIEEGMYIGDAAMHDKAVSKNQYYANKPPKPGWPYRDSLKALWEAGQYNDFADEVAAYQHFTMKLPENQVDGILGPKTSRSLSQQNVQEAPPTTSETTTSTTSTTMTATPETQTGTPPTQTPETTAVGKVAPADPAVANHPVAARILTPVKEAFKKYKAAETVYQDANAAMEKLQKAKKPAADAEALRETELGKMEAERNAARSVMATGREQLAALNASEFVGGEAELKKVRAYINHQLNDNTIYYSQGFNADILHGQGHKAAGRTCNMTVISMMLEALGKSTKDYKGSMTNLQTYAGTFEKQLEVNNSSPADLTSLRLPDFMQLVAIDMAGGDRDKAAGSITSHKFITEVARNFGLRLTEMKNGESTDRGEKANWFLSTKFTSKLDTIGALYRPAESDGRKEAVKTDEYKNLKGKDRDAYMQKYIQDFTEKRRLQYVTNVEKWIEIDTQAQEQLTALQAEVNKVGSPDAKSRPFDAEFQTLTSDAIGKLKDIAKNIPKEFGGKQKQLNALVKKLEEAHKKDGKKPDSAPKNLKALFDGKGSDDPLKEVEANLKKYEDLKKLYEKLGTEGGMEEILPVDQYKASIIPTMEAAIGAGNQVMVNLENHFVRLQSVSDEGIVIDDPGSRTGENNKVNWENARKYGYFQHYLLVSP